MRPGPGKAGNGGPRTALSFGNSISAGFVAAGRFPIASNATVYPDQPPLVKSTGLHQRLLHVARSTGQDRETVVAEKLHAVVTLGIANSRMKDFYDLWFLARRFDFKGATLLEAVRATFERRQTAPVTEPPIALTDAFATDAAKTRQWTAFLRKLRPRMEPPPLEDVISELAAFALPLLDALATGGDRPTTWPAGGPWSEE